MSFSSGAGSNTVEGNLIGTNKNGTARDPEQPEGHLRRHRHRREQRHPRQHHLRQQRIRHHLAGPGVASRATSSVRTTAAPRPGQHVRDRGNGAGEQHHRRDDGRSRQRHLRQPDRDRPDELEQRRLRQLDRNHGGRRRACRTRSTASRSSRDHRKHHRRRGRQAEPQPHREQRPATASGSFGGTGNRVSAQRDPLERRTRHRPRTATASPANDAGDGDTGPNNLQNFPVLTSATGGATTSVTGRSTAPPGPIGIEFFANAACDGTNGEGARFLGVDRRHDRAPSRRSGSAADLARARSSPRPRPTARQHVGVLRLLARLRADRRHAAARARPSP